MCISVISWTGVAIATLLVWVVVKPIVVAGLTVTVVVTVILAVGVSWPLAADVTLRVTVEVTGRRVMVVAFNFTKEVHSVGPTYKGNKNHYNYPLCSHGYVIEKRI